MKPGKEPIVVYSVYQLFRDMRSDHATASFSELREVELTGETRAVIGEADVPSISRVPPHFG
jgi:hypothetical protein